MSCANHLFFSRPQPCSTQKQSYDHWVQKHTGPNKTGAGETKAPWQFYNHAVLGKKVHELVFKHLKQLVQRMEPAEPLITVIYKPDSTLMRRQKLAAPSFSPLFLFSPPFFSTSVHLFHIFAPLSPLVVFFSASPCSHKISASVVFSSLPLCQLYLMDHSHALLCYFEKKRER